LLASHVRYTGSSVAEQVLDDWNDSRARFVKIMPRDYRRMLGVLARREKTHEPELIRHG